MRYDGIVKLVFILSAVLFLNTAAMAQIPGISLPVETPAVTAAPAETPPPPVDPLGRGTPKGMIQGFLSAVGSENYEQAAKYLDLRSLSAMRQKTDGPGLARDLQTLLDQGGWVAAGSKLSDSPEGDQKDNLASKVDLVGTISAGKKSVDILAERHDEADVGPVWQISRETVESIPLLLEKMATGPLDRLLPTPLIENKWYGVPVGHWAAIFSIAACAMFASWLLTFGVIYLIRLVWRASRSGHARHVLEAFVLPIRVYIALGMFAVLAQASGISIVARQNFILIAEIAAWLSLWWFLWRIIDIIAESVQERMTRQKKSSALSSVVFFRRSSRLILAAIAIALAMDRMGMNVTAWFAALGVGGLALAFGAQKTLENFVVGLTLIIDQPLRIGDLCKIGDVMGTVEDIGMRSTRIKPLTGTIVTIPNGTLASVSVENYTMRTHYWFHPMIGLRYETTPPQMRQFLTKLRAYLLGHDFVEKEFFRVHFVDLGKDNLTVEVFAYIIAESFEVSLNHREELLLGIMELVNAEGLGFAFPSQTVYLAKDSGTENPFSV